MRAVAGPSPAPSTVGAPGPSLQAQPSPSPAFPLLLHSPLAQAKLEECSLLMVPIPALHCDLSAVCSYPTLCYHPTAAPLSCPRQPRPHHHPSSEEAGRIIMES